MPQQPESQESGGEERERGRPDWTKPDEPTETSRQLGGREANTEEEEEDEEEGKEEKNPLRKLACKQGNTSLQGGIDRERRNIQDARWGEAGPDDLPCHAPRTVSQSGGFAQMFHGFFFENLFLILNYHIGFRNSRSSSSVVLLVV